VTSAGAIVRLVPVIAHAVAVFGDEQKATQWLSTPLATLGNLPPAELLGSDEGLVLVDETLTWIEHNIAS